MDAKVQYIISALSDFSFGLTKKSIFLKKPWVYSDENGFNRILFQSKNELIVSVNGEVTTGEWLYQSTADVLIMDLGHSKILLKQEFIDENIMVLKKDGTDERIMMCNENVLSYNEIPEYLYKKVIEKYEIKNIALENDRALEIRTPRDDETGEIQLLDANTQSAVNDGFYYTRDYGKAFHIKDGSLVDTYQIDRSWINENEILEIRRPSSSSKTTQSMVINRGIESVAQDGVYVSQDKKKAYLIQDKRYPLTFDISNNQLVLTDVFGNKFIFVVEGEKRINTFNQKSLTVFNSNRIGKRILVLNHNYEILENDAEIITNEISIEIINSLVENINSCTTFSTKDTNQTMIIRHNNSHSIAIGDELVYLSGGINDGVYKVRTMIRKIVIKNNKIVSLRLF